MSSYFEANDFYNSKMWNRTMRGRFDDQAWEEVGYMDALASRNMFSLSSKIERK